MKKFLPALFLIMVLATCRQTRTGAKRAVTSTPSVKLTAPASTFTSAKTPVPTSELAPYYGVPQPAKAIINGKTYNSEIGTTMWITEVKPDGSVVGEIGDAFAIITPIVPIITTSDLSLTLKLPLPINPTELWFAIYNVLKKELDSQDSTQGAFRWNPDYKTQTYQDQTYPPLLMEQQLTFSLEPGIYVFEVHAGWGGIPPHTELEADYGFLLEVQK